MQIKELRLTTNFDLDTQKKFYTEILAMPIQEESRSYFCVQAGATKLFFEKGSLPAYYHFAFNIPVHLMQSALHWTKQNLVILTDNGTELIDFPNWDAQAIYFKDPAGNILEFIGRRDILVERKGEIFHPKQIINISEIGLPSNDTISLRAKIEQHLAVPHYSGDSPRFYAMGNPEGLFILVDQNIKKWYPTDIPEKAFPLGVSFSQGGVEVKMSIRTDLTISLK